MAWPQEVVHELGRRHKLFLVDLPGHGSSARIHEPKRYAIEEIALDLCGVLDELRIQSADCLGYSMGGRIALATAALRPDRVRRLILESASPGLADENARFLRRQSDEALAVQLETSSIASFVKYWMDLPLFVTQNRLNPNRLQAVFDQRIKNDAASLAATLRGLGTGSQPSFWDALPSIVNPTLLVTGALDLKFRDVSEKMQDLMPNAERRVVHHAGHCVHLEQSQRYIEVIQDFLNPSEEIKHEN